MSNDIVEKDIKDTLSAAEDVLLRRRQAILLKKYKRNKIITSMVCLVLVVGMVTMGIFMGGGSRNEEFYGGSPNLVAKSIESLQDFARDNNLDITLLPKGDVVEEKAFYADGERLLMVSQVVQVGEYVATMFIHMPKVTLRDYRLEHKNQVAKKSFGGTKVLTSAFADESRGLATWQKKEYKYFMLCQYPEIETLLVTMLGDKKI